MDKEITCGPVVNLYPGSTHTHQHMDAYASIFHQRRSKIGIIVLNK